MMVDSPKPAWQSSDGESKLYCGDSLTVMSDIQSDSVDCIWTDPPYQLGR